MFSTCSELTPRAPILDGRMAQFMQPWLYIVYNSNGDSRTYSGIQRCCVHNNVHSQVYNTSSSQHGTQGAAPDQTYRISQHQFYWRTTLGIASHMLKISGATRSKKDYQRANIQPTRYYNHNLLPHGQQRLKISRGLPAAFHRRRAYLRLQMQASATHASSYNVGLWVCVEFVWVCIPLLSTSANECDVCRLRCVSLCALLVGVTHTI